MAQLGKSDFQVSSATNRKAFSIGEGNRNLGGVVADKPIRLNCAIASWHHVRASPETTSLRV